MFFKRWFGPNPVTQKGRGLYAAAVLQARSAAFYRDLKVPDTLEGRFELYSLHVLLILHRLKGQDPVAQEIGQALFKAYIQALDSALREIGVGDLSMAKKMRKLGEAFYGRIKAFDLALGALPDRTELLSVIGRTIYAEVEGAPIDRLCQYAIDSVEALSGQDVVHLEALTWPDIPANAKDAR